MPINDPTDLPTLQGWFSARIAATIDSPGGMTSSWISAGGPGRSFAFQSNKPWAIMSFPFGYERALRGVGEGAQITCNPLATYGNGPITIAVLCCPHVFDGGAGRWLWGFGNSGNNTPLLQCGTVSSKLVVQRRNNANQLLTQTSIANATNDPCLIVVTNDGSTQKVRLNGVEILSSSASAVGGAVTFDRFALLCSPRITDVNPSDGWFGEVIICSSALTGTALTDLEAWVMGLYQTSLPNQHLPPSGFPISSIPKTSKYSKSGGIFNYHMDLSRMRYSGTVGLYYVDWVNGNDSNPGTQGQPFKTLSKAWSMSDCCGVEIVAGLHPISSLSSYTRTQRSVTTWCQGGHAIICKAEDSMVNGWSLNTGSTYETTRTAATTRVVDLTWLNSDNEPQVLTSRASIALVDANPGSYFSDSVTGKVYVRTFDSRMPDDSLVVQIGTLQLRSPFSTANHFMMLENIVFVGFDGGQSAGALEYDFANCAYFFLDCESWYCTEWDYINALEVCRLLGGYGKSSSDILDYRGNVICVENGLFCSGAGSGDSDNATTGHGSAVKVACKCVYRKAQRTSHDIETTKNWYIDCDIKDAFQTAGSFTGVGVSASNIGLNQATRTWLDGCRITGSAYKDIVAHAGAIIACRYMRSTSFTIETVGNGQITFSEEPKGFPPALVTSQVILMPTRAKQHVTEFYVWDTAAGTFRVGEAANLTMHWVKDGTKAATTNTPSEVHATDTPGLYKITLTAVETDCDIGTLHGKSSTTGVVVIPVSLGFARLPDAAPGAANGVSLVGSAMTLTSAERTTLANEIESQIIDEADSEQVLAAIVDKINAMTDLDALTLSAIAAAIRSELADELARIDAAVSTRLAAADYEGSAGGVVQVLPLLTSVQTEPVRPAALVAYKDAAITHRVAVFDAGGEPIDLTGKSLQFVIEALDGNEVGHLDALEVDGPDSNQIVIDVPPVLHAVAGLDRYAVRDVADGARVWLHGDYTIHPTAGPHV